MENTDNLQLAEMIQVLRSELEKARVLGEKADILFETEKVELELKVAVTGTVKGEGGVKFWVVNTSGGMEKATANTHTFKLTLKPVPSGGGKLLVADVGEEPTRD